MRSSFITVALIGVFAIAALFAQRTRADELPTRERAGWARHFRAERVTGAAVALVGERDEALCYGGALCATRVIPASTFKIPNSLIALETGVLSGPEHVIPWDGVERRFPQWNQDLDLASAIKLSSVPYFQEVARRIGAGRMREWVSRLGFGNAEIGSVIDEFWLEGPLAISPLEEVRFFRRLDRGELPVSARSRSVVLDMLELSRDAHGVLRGKTGWAMPRSGEEHGWFVGSLEREGRPTIYIAVLVTEPTPRMVTARRAVAERILRELARSSGR